MAISYYIQIFILCIALILGQIFVFDLIHITGFGKLMVYPLMLMIIPLHVPRVFVMVIGFVIGYLLDFLLGTGGLHAAAMTFMGFSRGFVLDLLEPASGYEKSESVAVHEMGLRWFLLYVFLLIFIHQTFFYFIERFSFYNFIYTLRRIVTGTLLSTLAITLLTLLFTPTEGKRKTRL